MQTMLATLGAGNVIFSIHSEVSTYPTFSFFSTSQDMPHHLEFPPFPHAHLRGPKRPIPNDAGTPTGRSKKPLLHILQHIPHPRVRFLATRQNLVRWQDKPVITRVAQLDGEDVVGAGYVVDIVDAASRSLVDS